TVDTKPARSLQSSPRLPEGIRQTRPPPPPPQARDAMIAPRRSAAASQGVPTVPVDPAAQRLKPPSPRPAARNSKDSLGPLHHRACSFGGGDCLGALRGSAGNAPGRSARQQQFDAERSLSVAPGAPPDRVSLPEEGAHRAARCHLQRRREVR